jgi:hypothetical protein
VRNRADTAFGISAYLSGASGHTIEAAVAAIGTAIGGQGEQNQDES